MKTLYVHRKLNNGVEFRNWALKAGFPSVLAAEDFHVTIAFSKKEVDWDKLELANNNFTTWGGIREIKPLGSEGAVVLAFECEYLKSRWQYFIDQGASFDFPTYTPHVSITYSGPGELDFTKVKPFDGQLSFGPEEAQEVDLSWTKGKG